MATAIRSIPTLYGKEADSFLRAAQEVEAHPGTINMTREAKLMRDYLKTQNW